MITPIKQTQDKVDVSKESEEPIDVKLSKKDYEDNLMNALLVFLVVFNIFLFANNWSIYSKNLYFK